MSKKAIIIIVVILVLIIISVIIYKSVSSKKESEFEKQIAAANQNASGSKNFIDVFGELLPTIITGVQKSKEDKAKRQADEKAKQEAAKTTTAIATPKANPMDSFAQ